VAVGKVSADAPGLRKDNPDLFGAVREVEFHLEIELGSRVGFRCDFDGESGRAFEISTRSGLFDLGSPHEANIGLQASVRRQSETDFHHHVAKTALAHISSKSI